MAQIYNILTLSMIVQEDSFSSSDPTSQHKPWLDRSRSTVWENIEFENELFVPRGRPYSGTGSALAGCHSLGNKQAVQPSRCESDGRP